MHSINCSVDLDVEGILGYNTLQTKDGASEVTFVNGPLMKAMKNGISYILMKSIWQNLKRYHFFTVH